MRKGKKELSNELETQVLVIGAGVTGAAIARELTKGLRVVKPSEMVQVAISSREWQKISGEIKELIVSCVSRD